MKTLPSILIFEIFRGLRTRTATVSLTQDRKGTPQYNYDTNAEKWKGREGRHEGLYRAESEKELRAPHSIETQSVTTFYQLADTSRNFRAQSTGDMPHTIRSNVRYQNGWRWNEMETNNFHNNHVTVPRNQCQNKKANNQFHWDTWWPANRLDNECLSFIDNKRYVFFYPLVKL